MQRARIAFSSALSIAMAAKVLSCRLCGENIFTIKSLERQWPSRISLLLDIPVNRSDQLPSHVCSKCLTRVATLEKASENLAAFKISARSVMEQALRPLKRTKPTSGNVDVSPNTLRERPQPKIPRRLPFTSTLIYRGKL